MSIAMMSGAVLSGFGGSLGYGFFQADQLPRDFGGTVDIDILGETWTREVPRGLVRLETGWWLQVVVEIDVLFEDPDFRGSTS